MTKHDYSQNKIFHDEALRKLDNIEEEIATLSINHKHVWYWLIIIICLTMMFIVWLAYWQIEKVVNAPGIILSSGNVITNHNKIMTNAALLNDKAKLLEAALHEKQILFDKHNLLVDDLIAAKSNYIQARNEQYDVAAIASIVSPDMLVLSRRMYALIFISWNDGSQLHAGMKVILKSANKTGDKADYVYGKITSISSRPVSQKIAGAYLDGLNVINEDSVYLSLINLDNELGHQVEWSSIDAKIIVATTSPWKILRSKLSSTSL